MEAMTQKVQAIIKSEINVAQIISCRLSILPYLWCGKSGGGVKYTVQGKRRGKKKHNSL